MKKVSTLTLSALAAIALSTTGCGTDSTAKTATATANCDSTVIGEVLPSVISTNKTLSKDIKYGLDGKVVVEGGAKLTIPAGTTIAGCTGKSFLLIDQGAKIDANGTQANPIVFTSQKDLLGKSTSGAQGEWGGVTLLGNAPIMTGTATYEASSENFGGSVPTDNSGSLKYVVLKHSGYEVEVDKELNGLSLGGVGSGTTIENVAIIGGSDDAIEIWGGTVNITGLYLYNASDDSLDTDLGYRGTVTNVYAKQVTVDATDFNSAGMEFGNDHDNYTTDDTNATLPTVVNGYFDVVAGGLYMKNDAGAIFKNVTIKRESNSETDASINGMIEHRTDDVAGTNALTISDSNFSLVDMRSTAIYYSTANAKSGSNTKTAATFWGANPEANASSAIEARAEINGGALSEGTNNGTGIASGSTAALATIWKGKAGSNDPLEQ